MSPEVGRAASRFAVFITLTSALVIPLTEPASANRALAVITAGVGLLFLAVVALFARLSSRM